MLGRYAPTRDAMQGILIGYEGGNKPTKHWVDVDYHIAGRIQRQQATSTYQHPSSSLILKDMSPLLSNRTPLLTRIYLLMLVGHPRQRS